MSCHVDKQDILTGLRAVGINQGTNFFVHASMRAFGHVAGGAETVCDALLEATGPSGTAAVPVFTWAQNIGREFVVFDVRRDPCETGVIPEAFRQRPGALRSEHVCHSIAAIGPLALSLMGDGIHAFAPGGSLHEIYCRDFQCVFLGIGFEVCSAFHIAEELMQVPYRRYRHYKGSSILRADGSIVPAQSVEFMPLQPYHIDFARMEPICREAGLVRSTYIGRARIMSAPMRPIVDLAMDLLRKDPGALLSGESLRYWAMDNKREISYPYLP